jgi:GNAT superfamily N-acetyltransferase
MPADDASVDATDAARLRMRPFVEADDAEVTSWFADAGELRFFAGARLRWPLDTGQWRSIRLDPSVTAWTGVFGDDPTPIAHAEMIADSADHALLARLAVTPKLRGQGVGRAMMPILLSKARDAGFTSVTLAIHPDNSTAIRAYRSFGFEPQPGLDSSGRLQLTLWFS